MREPSLGITRSCCMCGKSYWCEDGDPFCSGKCEEEYEEHLIDSNNPGHGEEF